MMNSTAMSTKGKKTGTPNYKNVMLLNCIKIILSAGPEGWKIVASRYQIVSGEAGFRDVRRHFSPSSARMASARQA